MSEAMKLSVVMPAQNEEGSVGATVEGVVAALEREGIDYEVIVVNDDSEDSTEAVVAAIGERNPRVRVHRSHLERGFGNAIRAGLDVFQGDAVAIVMADASDNPDDLVVHQQDVQAVVNALWRGGAEAMMLMDQRVISTSAVRCVGNTLILQGRVYSPPYVITAIGDRDRMEESLRSDQAVGLFREASELLGLGYEVSQVDTATLPAYSGSIALEEARAAR